jgi:mannose-6-phosphate isomerase-like protein (cupin superfamily)
MATILSELPRVPVVVGPGETRVANPLDFWGEQVLVKVAGSDTNDQLSCTFHTVPPMKGPPRHQHQREDEMFYVVEGEVAFEIDGKGVVARAGTTLLAPRLSVHAYQNFTQQPIRLLVTTSPGGLDRLFAEVAELKGGTPEQLHALGDKYGLRIMGPPLKQ